MDMQAFDLVQQLCASHYLVRSLHVVAELGVADAVGEGGRSVDVIAAEVGADADALRRVLRLLESRGVFVLDGDVVEHSSASQFLRTGSSGVARCRSPGCSPSRSSGGRRRSCSTSVTTGKSAADVVFPTGGPWGYLRPAPG